jgi:DNA-binding response OmpR family regulator
MARILVVEEMVPLRRLFARALASDGHDVTAVGTAVQTLRILRQKTFDLMIIDLNLPGTPGETFARGLHRRFPAMKVIILRRGDRLVLGLSATDTFWAPFDVGELQKRVNISVTLPPQPVLRCEDPTSSLATIRLPRILCSPSGRPMKDRQQGALKLRASFIVSGKRGEWQLTAVMCVLHLNAE